MTYEIAIPSSNRVATLRDKTLRVLRASNVPLSRVTVWVPDEDQAARYRLMLGDSIRLRYGHGNGVRQARNAMAEGYPPGTRLIELDDDIESVHRYVDPKNLAPLDDLDSFFEYAFSVAGQHLWCVYPVANPYFMGERLRRGKLWYAEGAFFGYTVQGNPQREIVRLDDKEDFERSCRFFELDGEIVRFDNITFRSRFYKEPGGMQDYRTEETVKVGALRLQQMFPQLATAYVARSGHWEIRLRTPKR